MLRDAVALGLKNKYNLTDPHDPQQAANTYAKKLTDAGILPHVAAKAMFDEIHDRVAQNMDEIQAGRSHRHQRSHGD